MSTTPTRPKPGGQSTTSWWQWTLQRRRELLRVVATSDATPAAAPGGAESDALPAASVALAVMDAALELGVRHASTTTRVQTPLIELAPERSELALASIEVVIVDALAQTTARLAHTDPPSFALSDTVLARVAAQTAARQLARVTDVLGPAPLAEPDLADEVGALRRNLLLALGRGLDPHLQLPALAMRVGVFGGVIDDATGPSPIAGPTFDVTIPLPDFPVAAPAPDPIEPDAAGRLSTSDPVIATSRRTRSALLEHLDSVPGPEADRVGQLADAVVDQLRDTVIAITELTLHAGHLPLSEERHQLVERFCWLYTATACLHLHRHNHGQSLYGRPRGDLGWLRGALAYLLARANLVSPRRNLLDLLPMIDLGLHAVATSRSLSLLGLDITDIDSTKDLPDDRDPTHRV